MNARVGETGQARTGDDAGLDRVVDALRALRKTSQKSRYKNGTPPELPSRSAIVDIVADLVAVLYPRHFGPSHLTIETVDSFVSTTLRRALHSLREQIRKELQLFAAEDLGESLETEASRIADAFLASLPGVRSLLDTDIRAAFEGDPAARSLDEIVFCYPGIAAVTRHRLAHELFRLGAPMLARIIAEIAHSETGIDIHPGANVGASFFIDHGAGVVIGETTRIGERVRLYQGVTLGAKRFEADANGVLVKGQPRHPIVEDDVVVYAGATILGRITIGRGSSIGGNVWLTHSVPPGSNITQARAIETFDQGGGI